MFVIFTCISHTPEKDANGFVFLVSLREPSEFLKVVTKEEPPSDADVVQGILLVFIKVTGYMHETLTKGTPVSIPCMLGGGVSGRGKVAIRKRCKKITSQVLVFAKEWDEEGCEGVG